MSEMLTKERIFDAAENLLLEKSFHAVSLNEILKVSGIPKGSFYHHFTSKEAFGVELIKHYIDETYRERLEPLLNQDIEPNARLRILSHYESLLAAFIEHKGNYPCLILKLASEASFSSAAMREQISKGYTRRTALYAKVVQEAIDKGHIENSKSASYTAEVMASLWLGALKQDLSHQRVQTLRIALDFISKTIIPEPSSN